MAELSTTRILLPTGVTLSIQQGGRGDPIIFLHGFPESLRTWRHQMADLSRDYHVIAPDQRGFGASDKPRGRKHYRTDKPVEDLFALADALGLDRFTLVGHDWGGAIAWIATLQKPERLKRLVILNAPHPYIFQKSLFTSRAQRRASSYVRLFRIPGLERVAMAIGLRKLATRTFARMAKRNALPPEEIDAYVREWSQPGALAAMLNWYRAAKVKVPPAWLPTLSPRWLKLPFPKVTVPTLVVWGMKDTALLPMQIEGLDSHVEDLRLVTDPESGHFITWDNPELVNQAIRDFLAETPLD